VNSTNLKHQAESDAEKCIKTLSIWFPWYTAFRLTNYYNPPTEVLQSYQSQIMDSSEYSTLMTSGWPDNTGQSDLSPCFFGTRKSCHVMSRVYYTTCVIRQQRTQH